jgi:hypothetical protein
MTIYTDYIRPLRRETLVPFAIQQYLAIQPCIAPGRGYAWLAFLEL